MSHPNIRDVAKQAQVSVGTVSNVLNHPNQVSKETHTKVRSAMDELGFVYHDAMKNKISTTKSVGVVLPTSSNPFFEELTQGIEDAIALAGFIALVGYSREDLAIESQLLTSMIDNGFKGVIVIPVDPNNQVFEKFVDKNVRVGYTSQTDPTPPHCSLSIDQLLGGYIGIEYLHSLGHKKILWVSGPKKHYQSDQRFVGITQAAKEFGIELSVMTSLSLDVLAGEHICPQIIAAGPLPDAIFTANDTLAMGLINHFRSVGIDVPGRVSILGFDNTTYAESCVIPLSTVSQTPYVLGQTMGQQLIAELSKSENHVHEHVLFQPQIIERSSTAKRT